ncbi:MAG: YitT family protein [Gemmiger sp.]
MNRKNILLGWLKIVIGLLIFALGVHLTIRAGLGLAPWDCLGMGISYQTPLNYGLSMTLMSVIILLIDLWMKEKIGFGTIIDALLTGNAVQFFNDADPFPDTTGTVAGLLIIVAGLALMAIGQYFYMSAAQCCGPRDSLLIGLGKRLRQFPIGAVQVLLWAMVLVTGWLLGGSVGIGTLVSTFGSGIIMQMIFDGIRFEPRTIQHQSVLDTAKLLCHG